MIETSPDALYWANDCDVNPLCLNSSPPLVACRMQSSKSTMARFFGFYGNESTSCQVWTSDLAQLHQLMVLMFATHLPSAVDIGQKCTACKRRSRDRCEDVRTS